MALLTPGQSLRPGQALQSNNGLYTLTMQTDGNVVLGLLDVFLAFCLTEAPFNCLSV